MKERGKILLVAAIAFLIALSLPLAAAAGSEKGKAADFSLQDLKGGTVSLSSLKGKVVLLNFWATWCPVCVAEMPSLNRLYEELRQKGFEVVAVSIDRSAASVRDFRKTRGLAFPIVLDEDRQVTRLYGVFSVPTSFLINRKGSVVEKFFGDHDWTGREMKEKISKLLGTGQ